MTGILQDPRSLPQAPVLPSNGAIGVWSETDDKPAYNRALLSRSCNVQRGLAQSALPIRESRHHFANENHYAVPYAKYEHRAVERSQHGLHGFRPSEQEYENKARWLYREFLKFPGYQAYRNRQPKKGKKKPENETGSIWPDKLEHAFFRGAFLPYPPTSRETQRDLQRL